MTKKILALVLALCMVLGASAAMETVEQLKDRPDFAYHIYSGYGHAAFDTAPDYKERISRFFLG